MMNPRTPVFANHSQYGEFFHPVPLVALALLVLNDHWFKGANVLPRELTGKLSDFSGLLYFPLFVTAALRWLGMITGSVLPRWRSWLEQSLRLTPGKLLVSCAMTGVSFTALKLYRPFAELYLHTLGLLGCRASVTADPADLWALSSLVPAYWIGVRAWRQMDLSPRAAGWTPGSSAGFRAGNASGGSGR